MPTLSRDQASLDHEERVKRSGLNALIDEEREARLARPFPFALLDEAGAVVWSHAFDFDPESRENINGAASSATIAITINGAQPGDLQWHGAADPFVFITADNVFVPMDAPTVVQLGLAAANWKAAHIFAARALKDIDPFPEDFADDAYWPAGA